MKNFAFIDKNNVVINVSVGNDNWSKEGWIPCVDVCGIGYTYDAARDAFIAPKPYNSWVLDEATCQWQAPTPMPIDDKRYTWDEATTSWVEIENLGI
jgi:hypothetical protein